MDEETRESLEFQAFADAFRKKFGNTNTLNKVATKIERVGKPMFKPEDVHKVSDPITKLLRNIFVEENITNEYFIEAHAKFANKMNLTQIQTTTQRNNWMNAVKSTRISYKFFEIVIMFLFQYQLMNIELTFQTNNGEIKNYALHQLDEITNIDYK